METQGISRSTTFEHLLQRSDPPTLSVYEVGDELSNCSVCLSACKSTSYDFDLSSVSLAYTTDTTLLENTKNEIVANYQEAISLQQRVKMTSFMTLIGNIQKLMDTMDEYEFQAKFYYLDSKTSLMKQAELTLEEFKGMAINDTIDIYGNITDMIDLNCLNDLGASMGNHSYASMHGPETYSLHSMQMMGLHSFDSN